MDNMSRVINNQRRRIKVLHERNRRLLKRSIRLQSCLADLKQKQLMSGTSYEVMLKTLPPNAAAIFERCQKGGKEKFGVSSLFVPLVGNISILWQA